MWPIKVLDINVVLTHRVEVERPVDGPFVGPFVKAQPRGPQGGSLLCEAPIDVTDVSSASHCLLRHLQPGSMRELRFFSGLSGDRETAAHADLKKIWAFHGRSRNFKFVSTYSL